MSWQKIGSSSTEICRALQLLAGGHDASRACGQVEHDVAGGACIGGAPSHASLAASGTVAHIPIPAVALQASNIQLIHDVFRQAVAGGHFLCFEPHSSFSACLWRNGEPRVPYTQNSVTLLKATFGVGEALSLIHRHNLFESMPSSRYSSCGSHTQRSSHHRKACTSSFETASAFPMSVFRNV